MARLAEMVALRNVPLHDVAQQFLENMGIALVKISRKPPVIEVAAKSVRALLPCGVSEVFRIAEWKYFERTVATSELGAQLASQERRVGTGDTYGVAPIHERTDQPLPLRQLLNLVEEDRFAGCEFFDDIQQSREVRWPQSEEPRVFNIEVECTRVCADELRLENALTTAPNSGEHQSVKRGRWRQPTGERSADFRLLSDRFALVF